MKERQSNAREKSSKMGSLFKAGLPAYQGWALRTRLSVAWWVLCRNVHVFGFLLAPQVPLKSRRQKLVSYCSSSGKRTSSMSSGELLHMKSWCWSSREVCVLWRVKMIVFVQNSTHSQWFPLELAINDSIFIPL